MADELNMGDLMKPMNVVHVHGLYNRQVFIIRKNVQYIVVAPIKFFECIFFIEDLEFRGFNAIDLNGFYGIMERCVIDSYNLSDN